MSRAKIVRKTCCKCKRSFRKPSFSKRQWRLAKPTCKACCRKRLRSSQQSFCAKANQQRNASLRHFGRVEVQGVHKACSKRVFVVKNTYWAGACFCVKDGLCTTRCCLQALRVKSLEKGDMIVAVAAQKPNPEAAKRKLAGHGKEWVPDRVFGALRVDSTMPVAEYDEEFRAAGRPDAGLYKPAGGGSGPPKGSTVVRRSARHRFRGEHRTASIANVQTLSRGRSAAEIERDHRRKDMIGQTILYKSFALPGIRGKMLLQDAAPKLAAKLAKISRGKLPLILSASRCPALFAEANAASAGVWAHARGLLAE